MSSEQHQMATWKQRLQIVSHLQQNAKSNLYDRVKILCEIFDDRDFRSDCGNLDDFDAADKLDAYVSDTCATFFQLRRCIQVYPDQATWIEVKNIAKLIADAQEFDTAAAKDEATDEGGEKKQRARASMQQLRELEQRNRELVAIVERLEKENAWLKDQVDRLQKMLETAMEPAGV